MFKNSGIFKIVILSFLFFSPHSTKDEHFTQERQLYLQTKRSSSWEEEKKPQQTENIPVMLSFTVVTNT